MASKKKYCEHCGNEIYADAVICPKCGAQIDELKTSNDKANPQIVINNNQVNNVTRGNKECDKWVALLLCVFLGFLGAHKFYEGKAGLGILYILTAGLFCIGWIIDIIVILCKPNPYYV